MNEVETAIWAVIVAIVLVATVAITHTITREEMEKDAVANGAGHWEIVSSKARFAWGPDHAGHVEGCTD